MSPFRSTRARRGLLVALVVGLVASAGACSADGDRMTVYSGRTRDLVGPLLEQFSEETGIKIDVRYGDSADLALLIEQEGGSSDVDVFISQSPGATGFLASKNRLRSLSDDLLERVEPRFRSSAGDWVGLSGRVRVLVYDADVVDPSELPGSVFDLTDPSFRGRVGVAPSNGSFLDFVTAMREAVGDDDTEAWLEAMAGNDARPFPNNRAIVDAVGRGEIPFGLVNHYYNLRALAADPDLSSRNHFFRGGDLGGVVLVTAAAVLDTTDDVARAERLVEYLLSSTAQTYFSEETFEYPLAADVEAEIEPAIDELRAPEGDLSRIGAELARTRELVDASGIADG